MHDFLNNPSAAMKKMMDQMKNKNVVDD